MDTQKSATAASAASIGQSKLYRDLRARNERRINLPRLLEAQQRRRVERVLQVARQRRFRQNG